MASDSAPETSARAPARNEILLDAAIAVAVFAGSLALLAVGEAEHDEGVTAPAVVLVALASLPLVARRRAPLPVFVLVALASAVLSAIANTAGPPLGPTLAVYWLAAAGDEPRARTRLTLVIVAVLLVVHLAASGLERNAFPAVEILFGVLVWGGAWLAGDRTRLRRERMAELEERALRAEREAERERRLAVAEERARIARDLHDSAGHAINVILVHAGMGRLRTEQDPEGARAAFETIEKVSRETVGEIDQLVQVLREDDEGTPDRQAVEPPPGLAAVTALLERHREAGLDVTATVRGEHRALPTAVERGAYRILQEALTNAARHGNGSAEVELAFGRSALEVSVSNPLPPEPAARDGGGHGLIGMRERAELLGGGLDAGARDGRFRVEARLPLVPVGP